MSKETMTSRQRVLAALNHQTPDRVPIDLGGNQTGIHKFAYQALLEHLGIEDEPSIMDPVQQLARPCQELLERFHVDTRYIAAGSAADGVALARFNPDGSLDPGFGAGGQVVTNFGTWNEEAWAVALQADGQIVNIGSGRRLTVNRLLKILGKVLVKDVKPRYVDEMKGDAKHTLANVEKARRLIGYEPSTPLEEGLNKFVEWYGDGSFYEG